MNLIQTSLKTLKWVIEGELGIKKCGCSMFLIPNVDIRKYVFNY